MMTLETVQNQTVFLAPMAGVTDAPFRGAVRRFGFGDILFSEMIASRPMLEDYRRKGAGHGMARDLARGYEQESPLGVQLAGCDPDIIAEAARIHESHGAAWIDLNFGCPVKKVVNTMAGAALMRDESLSARIMEAVVRAVSVPVSIKMRLGWDEHAMNAPSMARIAENAGIQRITVHGRTRNQLYNGAADWRAVAQVREATALPIIINGDIVDTHTAKVAMEQSGADSVMIGRAAYGTPWMIAQVKAELAGEIFVKPNRTDIIDILQSHYEDILSHYGIAAGLKIGRKHIGWYLDHFGGMDDVKGRIYTMIDPKEVQGLLSSVLGSAALKAA